MEQLTLSDAVNRLASRRYIDAELNTKFYTGNHLQKENEYKGYIGLLPPVGDNSYTAATLWLERIFAASNMVKSAVTRNLDGFLSREPDYDLIFPENVPEAAQKALKEELTGASGSLIEWMNEKEILQNVLREAGRVCLLEETCYIRPRIPVAARDENGNIIYRENLAAALDLLEFEILTAEKAGIFTDEATGQRFSVCRLEKDNKQEVEISWVGEDGLTYLKILKEGDVKNYAKENFPTLAAYFLEQEPNPETDAEPLDLGGRLYLHEVRRDALITEPARSLQRSVNYGLTTMNKNLNIAGSRRIDYGNAQRPKTKTIVRNDAGEVTAVTETDAPLTNDSSNANFIAGLPQYDWENLDENGNPSIVGYSNVQQFVVDPVAVDTFLKATEIYRLLFLDEVHQSHILTNEQAAISGKSRQEARAEFEKSLQASKTAIDPAGRYVMEFALKLAAAFSNRTEQFSGIRFDFNCQITPGAIDLEETKQRAADVEKGRLSVFSYLVMIGTEDPDAEQDRLKAEPNYDLIQFQKAVEVVNLSQGALPLTVAVEMSAMTDEGKKQVMEALVSPAPREDEADAEERVM